MKANEKIEVTVRLGAGVDTLRPGNSPRRIQVTCDILKLGRADDMNLIKAIIGMMSLA